MTSAAVARKMMQVVGITAAVIIIAGTVYYRSLEVFPFALGVLLTSGINVLRLHMLNNAVEKAVNLTESKSAANYMRGQFLIRFVLLAAVLVASALLDFINLWGAVYGVFTLQISAYAMKFLYKEEVKDV